MRAKLLVLMGVLAPIALYSTWSLSEIKEQSEAITPPRTIEKKNDKLVVTTPSSAKMDHTIRMHSATAAGCARGSIEFAFSDGRVTLKERLDGSQSYQMEFKGGATSARKDPGQPATGRLPGTRMRELSSAVKPTATVTDFPEKPATIIHGPQIVS